MTKMKRITQIARDMELVEDVMVEIRENKVRRTLDNMVDAAKVSAVEARHKAQKVLNNLGKHADSQSQLEVQFNLYAELMCEAEDYERSQKFFEELRKKLEEDVEVKDDKENK